jgi:hypothetical protein
MLLLTLNRQDFVQIFSCWRTVLDIFWIRNWSRNQNFLIGGTGTAIKHWFFNFKDEPLIRVSETDPDGSADQKSKSNALCRDLRRYILYSMTDFYKNIFFLSLNPWAGSVSETMPLISCHLCHFHPG